MIQFFFPISLIFLIIASYTDLKERIVPNKLNFGMLSIGLIGHAVLAFWQTEIMILVLCIEAVVLAFVFSWVLWKIGVWAGGDVKLFTAIAALNPVNPAVLHSLGIVNIELLGAVQWPLFPITLFVFSVFAMLPYGAIISIHRLRKNTAVKTEFVRDLKKKFLSSIEYAAAVIGIAAVLQFFGISLWIELPLLIIYGLLKWKKFRTGIALLVFCFGLWQDWVYSLQWFFYLLVIFLAFFLLFRLYFLSKKLMRKKVKIAELEEGMIVSGTLLERDKKVFFAPEIEIKKIINYIRHNRLSEIGNFLHPKGRIIVSSANARGLIKQEIVELKKLAKEKKIEGNITIRESAPLIPAVLIAYIIVVLIGDLLWNWLFLL